jgi:hypothetical protein
MQTKKTEEEEEEEDDDDDDDDGEDDDVENHCVHLSTEQPEQKGDIR